VTIGFQNAVQPEFRCRPCVQRSRISSFPALSLLVDALPNAVASHLITEGRIASAQPTISDARLTCVDSHLEQKPAVGSQTIQTIQRHTAEQFTQLRKILASWTRHAFRAEQLHSILHPIAFSLTHIDLGHAVGIIRRTAIATRLDKGQALFTERRLDAVRASAVDSLLHQAGSFGFRSQRVLAL
jgi:hypothetical protein